MSYTDYNAHRDDTGDWDFLELEPYKDKDFRDKYTHDIIKEFVYIRFDEMDASEIETITEKFTTKGLQVPEYFNEMSQKSIDENGEQGLEEERRLAYVGITRAKTLAYISFSMSRFYQGDWIESIASRFVD